MPMNTSITTIDQYIKQYPENVQKVLQQIREIIHAAAPEAVEKISYGIPTFILKGNLVHFGGYKKHIGLYPGPFSVETFQKELLGYTTTKGTIQLPIDKPIPYDLITKIVKFRVKKSLEK